jgi:hypothetical protein
MAETAPWTSYGIHDLRIFDRSTGLSLGHWRILGDVNNEFNAEYEKLMGGSQVFPWDTAVKEFSSSVKATVKEYSADATALLLGGTLTEYSADTAGAVVDEANVKGTSMLDASTGIVGATVVASTGAADLKEGWFVVKAVTTSTVDVYYYNSASFARGTNGSFQDDDGKITATPLTISTGAAVEVPNYGIELTGGSGTIALVAGDTYRGYVQQPHTGAYDIKFGEEITEFPDVGVAITSTYEGGDLTTLILYKCKVAGTAIPFLEKGYSTYDVNIEPSYDADQDAYGKFTKTRS